jgi:serine/threonine-protein kinase
MYALGVIAFRVCTGRLPFTDTDDLELARQHAEAAPPRLRDLRPDAPAWLEALIERLLAKQPAERPTATETLAYLSNRR